MQPTIAVLIPCYNAGRWLGETLASVRAQTEVDTEVIVVDDGSDDDSVAVAQASGIPSLRIIQQARAGASRARTEATRQSTAPYVQYLDADDVLMPGSLIARVREIELSGADVVYTDWVRWERGADDQFRASDAQTRVLGPRPEIEILVDAWWPPGALLYRRPIVERILPWREDLPVIQDARFLLDASLAGARFAHAAHVGLRYRIAGQDSLSRRDPRAFLEDCLRSVLDVQDQWTRRATLDDAQRAALAKCYAFLTRSFFPIDRRRHDETLSRLLALDPNFVPDGPADFRMLARIVGFARAERIAEWCRPLKHALPRLPGRAS